MSVQPSLDASLIVPLIEGRSSPSRSETGFEVVNPSDGAPLFELGCGSADDVDLAVSSARKAFDAGVWSEAAPSFRRRTLLRFAELIAAHGAELDRLDAEEMGKPIGLAFGSAAAAADLMRYCGEASDKLTGEVVTSDHNSLVVQRRVPRGVVGAITPWNFPTMNCVIKLAPALAAGNCVVLKPSELSTRSGVRLGGLAVEAGLPPGVLNVVPGLGEPVGRALGLHHGVDMLTFTGSTATGKRMLEYAAHSNLKKVMLECGGKSAQVVFADVADLPKVSAAIARRLVTNQGQICSVGSRLIVQRSIEQPLLDLLQRDVAQIVVGSALDARTTYGPISSRQQCERVLDYIGAGLADGADIVSGGRRLFPERGGFYVEPTIFRGVRRDSRIAQEEIFGPVLSVIAFDDEDEAVRIANGTIYGLTSNVWTSDLGRALRMSRALRCSVQVNAAPPMGEGPSHNFSSEPSKQSGFGAEGGIAGIHSYTRRQQAWFNHA